MLREIVKGGLEFIYDIGYIMVMVAMIPVLIIYGILMEKMDNVRTLFKKRLSLED
jgi:thiosulfate reductase cytochrome b subunit